MTAALVALGSVGVKPAAAQSLDLSSSMTALCVGTGGTCETVEFRLAMGGGDYFLDAVRIFSSDATMWQFGSLLGAWDSSGNAVDFFSMVSGDQLVMQNFASNPSFVAEPLRLSVAMSNWGNYDMVGSMSYTANGETSLPFDGDGFFSTAGRVSVPEPSAGVLLAAGLLGLLFVVRTRKEEGALSLNG